MKKTVVDFKGVPLSFVDAEYFLNICGTFDAHKHRAASLGYFTMVDDDTYAGILSTAVTKTMDTAAVICIRRDLLTDAWYGYNLQVNKLVGEEGIGITNITSESLQIFMVQLEILRSIKLAN